MRGLIDAIAFFTTVPARGRLGPHALVWAPLVGGVVGTVVAGAWGLATWAAGAATGAAVAVAVDLLLTGAIHADGLLDSADGLLPHMERRRRLDVMAEPAVGAFAVVTCVVVLGLRWSALFDAAPTTGAVAASWGASRACAASALLALPTARPDGLAETFRGSVTPAAPLAVAALVATPGILLAPVLTSVAVATTAVGATGCVALAWRRLGGVTGDVLGAAIVIGETFGLVAIAGL